MMSDLGGERTHQPHSSLSPSGDNLIPTYSKGRQSRPAALTSRRCRFWDKALDCSRNLRTRRRKHIPGGGKKGIQREGAEDGREEEALESETGLKAERETDFMSRDDAGLCSDGYYYMAIIALRNLSLLTQPGSWASNSHHVGSMPRRVIPIASSTDDPAQEEPTMQHYRSEPNASRVLPRQIKEATGGDIACGGYSAAP